MAVIKIRDTRLVNTSIQTVNTGDLSLIESEEWNRLDATTLKVKNENSIVYLAELDGDIDDIIAIEYLYNNNLLKCVVCDPLPSTKIGKIREKNLDKLHNEYYMQVDYKEYLLFYLL